MLISHNRLLFLRTPIIRAVCLMRILQLKNSCLGNQAAKIEAIVDVVKDLLKEEAEKDFQATGLQKELAVTQMGHSYKI